MMIERKFKVGDRVRVVEGAFSTYFVPGNTGTVVEIFDDISVRVQFDKPYHSGGGRWLVANCSIEPLLPAIPAGWTPASEPPIDDHDVRVLTKNGDGRGWYGESIFPEETGWRIYPSASTFNWKRAAPGEVLAWREIEPAAQVRYVVCAIPTLYDTLEEAELHAQRTVESLHVNVVIARVVEEVKPGKPVITKLEE